MKNIEIFIVCIVAISGNLKKLSNIIKIYLDIEMKNKKENFICNNH